MSDAKLKALAERIEQMSIPEPNSGCWLWLAQLDRAGYGRIKIGGRAGRSYKSHRISWLAFRGSPPRGMCVCHKCDVRSCVNPDHLFLGTNAENTADMMAKGRHRAPKRESHGRAKLTEEQAAEVRAATGTQRQIAARFGVSHATVGAIKLGRRWQHKLGERADNEAASDAAVANIQTREREGASHAGESQPDTPTVASTTAAASLGNPEREARSPTIQRGVEPPSTPPPPVSLGAVAEAKPQRVATPDPDDDLEPLPFLKGSAPENRRRSSLSPHQTLPLTSNEQDLPQ